MGPKANSQSRGFSPEKAKVLKISGKPEIFKFEHFVAVLGGLHEVHA